MFLLLLAGRRTHPDQALIDKALRGRRSALTLLVRRLMPVIQARSRVFVARRRSGRIGSKDADDLAQEVWLALLGGDGRLLRAYDPNRGMSLEGYVGLLTRRQLWRNVEAQSAQKRAPGEAAVTLSAAPEPAETADPEQLNVARDLLHRLRRHLDTELPARGRLVLAALYDDGMDAASAASFIGVSTQVVYNWQHRIRTLSRQFIDGTTSPA